MNPKFSETMARERVSELLSDARALDAGKVRDAMAITGAGQPRRRLMLFDGRLARALLATRRVSLLRSRVRSVVGYSGGDYR